MSLSEHQIIEFESLLEDLETAMARCYKELLTQSEAMRIYNDFWQRALGITKKDSDEWRTLDRIHKNTSAWWEGSLSGYVLKKDCEHFAKLRTTLKQLLEDNEPEFLRTQKRPKNQLFFSSGEIYEAKKAIFEVMKGAKTSLHIVDQYLDETIFDYLESLDHAVLNEKEFEKKMFKIIRALGQTTSLATPRLIMFNPNTKWNAEISP